MFEALMETYVPPSLTVSEETPSKLQISQVRKHLERIYVAIPHRIWLAILNGDAADIWRWEDPARTGKWAAVS
jgi:hypothetical protein